VDLVSNVLKDGVAVSKVAHGAEVNLGNAAWYSGGAGEARGAHAHG